MFTILGSAFFGFAWEDEREKESTGGKKIVLVVRDTLHYTFR